VLTSTVEITQLPIALAQVEVKRRVQPGHRKRHPGLRHPRIGEQVGGRQRSLVPAQLLAHVILHIGNRVRARAPVQGIPLLAADLVPDLCEQETRGLPLALVAELYSLADPDDRRVRDHRRFLPRFHLGQRPYRRSGDRHSPPAQRCHLARNPTSLP
jgi:hypothetical protein